MSTVKNDGTGALGRALRQVLAREAAKPQPKLLDETTTLVRVLALPSQPVEITWLDCYGNIIRVEERTFEP